jgi:hypothetical protein
VPLERGQIKVLRGVARAHDALPARLDLMKWGFSAVGIAGKQRALQRHFRDCAIYIAEAGGLTDLGARIQHLQDPARILASFLRTLDDNLVAVRVGDDAKTPFDLGDVLVVMTKNDRRQTVVIEGQRNLGRFGVSRFGGALSRNRGNPGNRPVLRSQSFIS